ncbi:MAG TPA: Calx-beta domain-containing protein [Vicinamibacteria bacterium]|nr:Calx-beta domain-containing protein [Vicinamibacteria bacterium]
MRHSAARSIIGLALLVCGARTVQAWDPPIGVPMPPFGVNEAAGPATHYVDNTHPSATNTNNPNGSPALPRMTVPTSTLPAGSVVEIHGGPYQVSDVNWRGNGTPAAPVFIRGVGSPVFSGNQGHIDVGGTNLIVEGLVLRSVNLSIDPGSSRVALRYNDIGVWPSAGPTSMVSAHNVTDVVVLGNHIHDAGDINSTQELDIIGVVVDDGSQRVWVVDNWIHHLAGDSVRVGDNPPVPEPWARYLYVARNEFHDNQENGLDVKQSRDIIVSQNNMHHFKVPASGTDDGTALVVHYDAERVWILFNKVHDSSNGIRCTGAADGYYVIGNVVWNIRHEPGDPYDPNSMFGVQAIRANSTPRFSAINNTVFGSDGGISYPNGNQGEFINNLIGGLTQPSHHIAVGSGSGNVMRNNVFDATARIRFGGSTVRNCPQTVSAFPSQVSQCINANPQLGNPGALDFHIAPTSPAVNAGLNGLAAYARFLSLYGVDISRDADGIVRPVGPAFDIGAYEVQPTVSVFPVTLPEGQFPPITHSVPLVLNGASPLPVQVGYVVAAGTATAGVDFVAATGTAVIPPFTINNSVPVTILPDLQDEPNETYTVTLNSATNATLGVTQAVGTIVDDDPQPELVVTDCGVVEGNSGSTPCRFGVALSAASSFPVSVNYATASGTAVAGQDFTATSGALSFAPGTFAAQTIDVPVTGDASVEADEQFTLNLTGAVNATTPFAGTGLILDDDAPPLSTNEVLHGWSQTADLASTGSPDVDYYRIAQRARTSWEVVVDEVSGDIAPGLVLERLASDNSTVLQSASAVGTGSARSMRWENTTAADLLRQTLRVRSTSCTTSCDSNDTYRIRVYETTMTLPRFNNLNNSSTVMIVQNRNRFAVNGTLWFWTGAGQLVYARAFTVPAGGLFTLSPTQAVPILGLAGSATLTSNAPYGSLAVKAATIDPSGGFAFDAPFEPKLK